MSKQMSENTIALQETFENLTKAPKGRFANVKRDYTLEDVKKLSGSITVEHSLARHTAEKMWALLHSEDYVNTLGAMTGNQAMQQIRAGLIF